MRTMRHVVPSLHHVCGGHCCAGCKHKSPRVESNTSPLYIKTNLRQYIIFVGSNQSHVALRANVSPSLCRLSSRECRLIQEASGGITAPAATRPLAEADDRGMGGNCSAHRGAAVEPSEDRVFQSRENSHAIVGTCEPTPNALSARPKAHENLVVLCGVPPLARVAASLPHRCNARPHAPPWPAGGAPSHPPRVAALLSLSSQMLRWYRTARGSSS